MSEAERINRRLEKYGKMAYERAKSMDMAFVVIGNGIYRISSDDTRYKVRDLPITWMKVRQKRFEIK